MSLQSLKAEHLTLLSITLAVTHAPNEINSKICLPRGYIFPNRLPLFLCQCSTILLNQPPNQFLKLNMDLPMFSYIQNHCKICALINNIKKNQNTEPNNNYKLNLKKKIPETGLDFQHLEPQNSQLTYIHLPLPSWLLGSQFPSGTIVSRPSPTLSLHIIYPLTCKFKKYILREAFIPRIHRQFFSSEH